jgi:[CysO sulfur-carrier protein]-S-L-cysteine hydrolase
MAPNECCGLIFGEGETAKRIFRARNVHPTPVTRYEIDPAQLREALSSVDDERSLVGIYHSHPVTEPRPSSTDVANAYWPDQVYVLTSLRNAEPEVYAYRIKDGAVTKIPIVED